MAMDNILFKLSMDKCSKDYLEKKVNSVFNDIDRIRHIIEHVRTFSRDQKSVLLEKIDINETIKMAIIIVRVICVSLFICGFHVFDETGAKIEIYDLQGNVVGAMPASTDIAADAETGDAHTFIWTPDKSVPSGIYLVKARMENGQEITKRIIYLK